jgi:bifunctional non-homologous end joining protein LigD
MIPNQKAETIALFFQNGSSDKEYHVHLKPAGEQWLVEIQYGKRASALRSALKTKEPIEYSMAKNAYDKIVADQLKQGYTPSEGGQAYQDTPREKSFTGVLPQLLNSIDEESFSGCISNDAWMLQEKFDGQRLILRKNSDGVCGINRDGLMIAVPTAFEEMLNALPCKNCVIDGEWLGERYAAFDIMEIDGVDLRPLGSKQRKDKLDQTLALVDRSIFLHVLTAYDSAAKQALHDMVKAANGEGVVAKKIDSTYCVGRPNSGGDQLKRKFVESATVLVSGLHATKRSISVSVSDDTGTMVEIGNVTIPANHALPAKGDIVEVHYLYAYKGGSLYQPVYKGPRVDQTLSGCNLAQLKYKSEGPATAPKKKMKV